MLSFSSLSGDSVSVIMKELKVKFRQNSAMVSRYWPYFSVCVCCWLLGLGIWQIMY